MINRRSKQTKKNRRQKELYLKRGKEGRKEEDGVMCKGKGGFLKGNFLFFPFPGYSTLA